MTTQACLALAQITSLPATLSCHPRASLKTDSGISASQGLRLLRINGRSLSQDCVHSQRLVQGPVKQCRRVVASVATEEVEVEPSPAKEVPATLSKVKSAAPAAVAAIALAFPIAIEYESFIHACKEALFELGFNQDNCIALVNTCRDEVCRPLVSVIDNEFGHSFNISGLGGLVNCGVTGLKAGMSHSPEHPCEVDGTLRERYVFFAFPHISIGESGQEGSLLRRGRNRPSSACGALIAVKGAAKDNVPEEGTVASKDDWEFDVLKRKVLAKDVCKNCGETGPSLVAVTKAAQEVITEDLMDLISKTVDPSTADYAVITGVQIHSGCQIPGEPFSMDRIVDYIAPSTMFAVIRGERYLLHCELDQITKISSIKAELHKEPAAKPEEVIKLTPSADTQAQLDEGRVAMREWWLTQLAEKKATAAQVEMDKGRAEMRAWWEAQLESKELIKKQAEMDFNRAEMRAWWMAQLEEKEAASKQAEMDKARAEMRAWWLSQLEQKEKQEEMDKGRAEMRAWWMSELEKKAEREAAAKQAEMDKARAEMRAWAEAKAAQEAEAKQAAEEAEAKRAAEEAASTAALATEGEKAAAESVAVPEEVVVEDKQIAMDRARAEMRDWWVEKWDTKKKVMGWSPYSPVWTLEPAEGSLISTSVSLSGSGIIVGSSPCDPSEATALVVDSPQVSPQHAKVYGKDLPRRDRKHERGYFVMDLGSKEGTYMNKLKLAPNKEVRLMDGDTLKFGDAKVALVVKKGVAVWKKANEEVSPYFWGA